MVKIRVFELARDLNMTTKELMGNLEEMGIEVSSHMSSLEDDTVSRIRGGLFAEKAPDVEETRIRPTVIRRRRKATQEPDVEEARLPKKTLRRSVVGDAKSIPESDADRDTVSSSAEDEAISETVMVEEQPSSSGEETDQETVAKAFPQVETDQTPDALVDGVPERFVSEEEQGVSETASTDSSSAREETGTAEAEEEEPAIPSDGAEEVAAVSAKPKKTKEKKKARKDTPAKIIQLPEKPVAPPREEKKPLAEAAVPVTTLPEIEDRSGVSEQPASTTKEKKGKRGKKEEIDPDKKFLKKKTAFRRKEVIEGAALYTGQRATKGRKKGKVKQVVGQKPQITVAKAIKRRIKIDDTIVLSDLAKRMGIKPGI